MLKAPAEPALLSRSPPLSPLVKSRGATIEEESKSERQGQTVHREKKPHGFPHLHVEHGCSILDELFLCNFAQTHTNISVLCT